MNSLDLVNKIYKPYRITKLSNTIVFETTEGKYAIKEKSNIDIKELFMYLSSRDFYNYPNIIDDTRSEINIYEYIEETKYPKEEKALDMIKIVANLHKKTSYEKEVTEDKFKEIYDNLKNNLMYYKNLYKKYVSDIEEEIYMSPSHYLFIRNSSKLLSEISFCESKLDDWYDKVKNKRSIRVSLIHNNLSLDHYIKGSKEALISWDKSTRDTRVLDLCGLYKKESLNIDFKSILKEYEKHFPLEDYERELFFIMICMPVDIEFTSNEFESCKKISKLLDYVYKVEELVRPYYTGDSKEEK